MSGSRAPRIAIAATDAFSSLISLDVNRTPSAAVFSSMCAICVVPGIGTIHGFLRHQPCARVPVSRDNPPAKSRSRLFIFTLLFSAS
jgi:hypothetical protein